MFVPIGDEPNPRGTPWVNYLLIAANVAVYILYTLPLGMQPADTNNPLFAEYVRMVLESGGGRSVGELLGQISAYDLFVLDHGYRPSEPEFRDILTAMFLHANVLHLAGNMLFLWIYGDNVEARLGRPLYLFTYLVTGALATWTHAWFAVDSPVPSLGASGAISGVLGFYFLYFPHNSVRMLVALFPFYMDVIRIPARIVLGFYLVLDNVIPFVLTSSSTGVAYGAHIGGFVGGLLMGWLFGNREPGGSLAAGPTWESLQHHPREQELHSPAHGIHELVRRGDLPGAVSAYSRIWDSPAQREVDAADAVDMADWLGSQGKLDAAMAIYRRILTQNLEPTVAARAHLGLGLVLLKAGRATSAYQELMTARELGPDGRTADAIEHALRAIREMQKFKFRGR